MNINKDDEMVNNRKNKLMVEGYSKFRKAIMLVKQKKVKKYVFKPSNIERWIVEGKRRKYLVIPNLFCQCENFYIFVVIKKKERICYHLLAQKMAEENKEYDEIILSDNEYDKFMENFREN
ncbi:MAG: hypothetical protein NZ926_01660 [Candidatus Methanomethylicia archaeon]|nr:hypothetical protein [Candidatus Methanomethylicia archaeon]MCX8169126.1 hypothetical protein [Candidatus Methanomethylicia archaeon]MDW7988858.1 hypothetical protein [Nitrososphaerota archaeon]